MKNEKKSIYEFFKSLDIREDYNTLKEKFRFFLEENSGIIKTDNRTANKCVEIGEYIRHKQEQMVHEKLNKNKTTNYNIKEILNAKKT